MTIDEYSPEWWEGFNCQGPKSCNPYNGDQAIAWLEGWQCRYYGEKP